MKEADFKKEIQKWSKTHSFDHLPWRQTRDPYAILVSEVMLQQTQISRVIEKYLQWMKKYPTMQSLAKAPFRDVLHLWQGLGYNRRAKYLSESAKRVVHECGGNLPEDPKQLQNLPGIGHYTAHAVACFAHGNCKPFCDTNIRRVILHFFFQKKKTVDDKEVLSKLEKIEPKNKKREWYLTLMDYGREELGKKRDNANRRSKSYIKQSRFLGSRRYVRAAVIRFLLKHPNASRAQIEIAIRIDGFVEQYLQENQLADILNDLVQEKMIIKKAGMFAIK